MPIFGDEFIAELRLKLAEFAAWLAGNIPVALVFAAILANLVFAQQIILSILHGLL